MEFIKTLGLEETNGGASTGAVWLPDTATEMIRVISPVDGKDVAVVHEASLQTYEKVVEKAQKAFVYWRVVPAPKRGEIIRQIGLKVRDYKTPLGTLIAYEMGKPLQEGLGEVQEMIDICDFAVGQSRMLHGFSMHSERPRHRMYEQYHPLGVVGIATAFNFPVAVWSWNAMIAAVCGNVTLWKPSSQVPLSAIALQKILAEVVAENELPEGIFSLIIGRGARIGERMLADKRIPLISFTGSVRVGRHAAEVVAQRLGKTILELSGNNAIIITDQAHLNLALPAVVFGAVGTAGQRCTTTRRLIVHEKIYPKVREALVKAYKTLRIGTPLDKKNHLGPLVNLKAVSNYLAALKKVQSEGGRVICGGQVLTGPGYESGCYVTPSIVEAENHFPTVQAETFGPILYLIKYSGDLTEAVALQNDVTQGLSSAIFTHHLREAETFLSPAGSDCGIANVNIGTSGAEIGGAFGGEKEALNQIKDVLASEKEDIAAIILEPIQGELLLSEIEALAADHPGLVKNGRGLGLMCAFDAPDNQTRNQLLMAFLRERLLMVGCGEKGIRFRPHLIVTAEEIRHGMGIIRKVIENGTFANLKPPQDPCLGRGT